MKTVRILIGGESSTQTGPLKSALEECYRIGILKKSDVEKKTLKEIRKLRWTSQDFISWGRGDDLPAGRKVVFIMASHPLQLDDPPAWDHLKHLADMRTQFQGKVLTMTLIRFQIIF